jgi:hypothetical protein
MSLRDPLNANTTATGCEAWTLDDTRYDPAGLPIRGPMKGAEHRPQLRREPSCSLPGNIDATNTLNKFPALAHTMYPSLVPQLALDPLRRRSDPGTRYALTVFSRRLTTLARETLLDAPDLRDFLDSDRAGR